jgi:hypothetical protein
MSSLASEVIQARRRPPAPVQPQPIPQTLRTEDVARTLLRLQMRIRELETELTALRAAPSGWR